MRIILLALIITLAAQSKAQELQLCGGNTYEDELKGEPILPNETQLDYATRIGLESDQFSSKKSDANGSINCQKEVPLPSNLKYNQSGLIIPSIGGRRMSDVKGRYIDNQLVAVGYKDISSLSAAREKFDDQYDDNFQSNDLLGYDHIPEFNLKTYR